jgi:ATP-dependent Lon protease
MAKRSLKNNRAPRPAGLRAEAAAVAPEAATEIPLRRRGHSTGPLPGDVTRQAQREMDRLRRLPAGSVEAAQVRTYLQWLWALPWQVSAPEETRLERVQEALDRDHLGLARAKERVLEYLAVRMLKPDLPGPVLGLVGPPGTGKTSLCASIARALGRPFVRVPIGGISEPSELTGEGRSGPAALPGKIVRALREAGANNPVILIDGVDKLGGDAVGHECVNALREVLDPESNRAFVDHYLGLPFDLSRVMFILCAHNLEMIPDSLLDRMDVIEVPGYSEDDKLELVRRYLLARQLAEHGLSPRDLTVADEVVRAIIRQYTLEAGVRGLTRQLARLCRKVALARAGGNPRRHTVTLKKLEAYLGHPVYAPDSPERADEVGVATGLACTSAGGEILVVEALKMPGQGRITTTGQLGDVMRESVQTAHSYVRSRAEVLEIDPEAFNNFDIHIHFPAGGVPKDGPSAGITVCLVIASVLSEKPVRNDVAVTGEVSLRGKVLSVGGLREKALAAYRAGVKTLVFPAANQKDVGDIPDDIREKLELVAVESMDEVFQIALHRVILPQRLGGDFVIEMEDGESEEDQAPAARPAQSAARKATRPRD